VYGAVFVLLTLLISVVLIKHFDGQSDQNMTASAGAVAAGDPSNDLTNSAAPHGPAASSPSAGTATSAASAATEPPNPFKAFLENGKSAAPVAKAAAPASTAAGSKASAEADPFKAFLDSGQASAAAASSAAAPAADAQAPAADPFKEALERQQQQQPPR
jgi:hypothetical protein